MWLFLDLAVCIIILLCVIIYAKRGFVKSVFGIIAFVAAIVLAFMLSTPLSDFTYDKLIEPTVSTSIENTLVKQVTGTTEALNESVFDALPGFIKNNIDEKGFSAINILEVDTAKTIADKICESVVKPGATYFLKIIFSLILFIILSFVFKFVVKLLNKIFSFSIIGKVNKILGAIIGVIMGLVISMLFILMVNVVVSISGGFWCFTHDAIEQSKIFGLILEFLPIKL